MVKYLNFHHSSFALKYPLFNYSFVCFHLIVLSHKQIYPCMTPNKSFFFVKFSMFTNFFMHIVLHQNTLKGHTNKWLQTKVALFLHCNLVFWKVASICMLLTWHKNNNFPNLWLDLDCQIEKTNIYFFNCNIYTPNI